QPEPTAIYYYFEARWPWSQEPTTTPPGGKDRPAVYFVSSDHFGDLDRHQDLFDLFDLIRMLRAIAWNEGTPDALTDLDGDGRVTDADVRRAVGLLATAMGERPSDDPVRSVTPGP